LQLGIVTLYEILHFRRQMSTLHARENLAWPHDRALLGLPPDKIRHYQELADEQADIPWPTAWPRAASFSRNSCGDSKTWHARARTDGQGHGTARALSRESQDGMRDLLMPTMRSPSRPGKRTDNPLWIDSCGNTLNRRG
jgi:hypothetical protein